MCVCCRLLPPEKWLSYSSSEAAVDVPANKYHQGHYPTWPPFAAPGCYRVSCTPSVSPAALKIQCCCSNLLLYVWFSSVNVCWVMKSSRSLVTEHSFIMLTVDLYFPPTVLKSLPSITEISFCCLDRIQPEFLSHTKSNCLELLYKLIINTYKQMFLCLTANMFPPCKHIQATSPPLVFLCLALALQNARNPEVACLTSICHSIWFRKHYFLHV